MDHIEAQYGIDTGKTKKTKLLQKITQTDIDLARARFGKEAIKLPDQPSYRNWSVKSRLGIQGWRFFVRTFEESSIKQSNG